MEGSFDVVSLFKAIVVIDSKYKRAVLGCQGIVCIKKEVRAAKNVVILIRKL